MMKIELLADHPEFIPTLARWHHREWPNLRPGDSVVKREASLRERCRRHELPITYVAIEAGEPVGSATLLLRDTERTEFSPWLSTVFVATNCRGRGIGRALVEHAAEQAQALGFNKIYLCTPGARTFFEQLGWSVVEETLYRDTPVAIMALEAAVPAGR